MKWTVPLLLLIASLASAQTTVPSAGRLPRRATVPATGPAVSRTAPATQPSADELHAQAVEFMRLGKFDKARAPLEKAYSATPPQQRGRSLVLNRAILDLQQKSFVMRALRDLNDYLTKHRADDEVATNIFGSALNLSADNPKLKQGAIWQSALREWDRRNYVLDHSRPGFHRWGPTWLNEEEYLALRDEQKKHAQSVVDQQERVDRAVWRIGPLEQRYQELVSEREYLRKVMVDDSYLSPQQRALARQRAGQKGGADSGLNATDQKIFNQTQNLELARNAGDMRRIQEQIAQAQSEVAQEQKQLGDLQQKAPRPTWPKGFDAIDPNEPPPKATTSTAPATLPIGPDAAARKLPIDPNAATQPAGGADDPLSVPFGPREVDRLQSR